MLVELVERFDTGEAPIAVRQLPAKSAVCAGRAQPVVAGVVLVRDPHGLLQAFDVRTLAPRWSTSLAATARCFQTAGTDDVVVVTVIDSASARPQSKLIALDAKTGTELWTRDVENAPTWTSGNAVYVITNRPNTIVSLDARTGRQSWARVEATPRTIVARGRRVVLIGADGVFHVADAQTGADVAELKVGTVHQETSIAIDGDMLYAYVQTSDPDELDVGLRVRAVAIDVARAKLAWQSAAISVLDGHDNAEGLALTRRDLALCTRDGMLRVIDRSSGDILSQHGLGRCAPMVAGESKAGTETWLYFRHYGPRMKAFSAVAAESESAIVTGTVTGEDDAPAAGARVAALGVETIADDSGRYELRVRGTGNFVAQALVGRPEDAKCERAAHAVAPPAALTGAGRYVTNLRLYRSCACGAQ